MLLLVSQYLGKTRAISEASRELSLIKKPFSGSDGLAEALNERLLVERGFQGCAEKRVVSEMPLRLR